MRRSYRIPVLTAIAVAALLAPDARAATKVPRMQHRFTWVAQGCTEGVALIPVPADRAREQIPQPFGPALGNAGTTVRLLLGALSCERLRIGSVDHGPVALSDAGLLATDPDGAGAVYHLWQISDASALQQRMSRLGMRADTSRGLSAPYHAGAAATTASGTVPWRDGDYGLDVVAANPESAARSTSHWWHRGSKGLIRTTYTFSPRTRKNGASTVQSAPEGALARLLGTDRSAGQGVVIDRFDIVVDVYSQR